MAITCPRCGAQYDVTLFEFDHPVACPCGQIVTLGRHPGRRARGGVPPDEPRESPRAEDVPPSDDS